MFSFLKKTHWTIAFRKQDEEFFNIIPNPKYGWCADPFLVEFQNDIYLFAEVFLYKSERNGVLAYCKFNGSNFDGWTVTMDKHWHLSYPNVFVENGKLYMVPESYQMEEVALYELKSFPDNWEKVKTLIKNVKYCDSTFFEYKQQKYMFTFEPGKKSPNGNGILIKFNTDNSIEKSVFSTNVKGARCGGKIISEDGKLIRVAQNSENGYGTGLIFYQIDSVWPNYSEHEIKSMSVSDFIFDETRKNKKKFVGIHTYNKMAGIEVIDLKYKYFSLQEYFASNRVKKVFMNKY